MTSNADVLPPLRLKKNEDKRLRAGHLWVYSNEVDTKTTPLKAFAAGQCVTVENAQGNPLGSAYLNPNSLICARLYTRQAHTALTLGLIYGRLEQALNYRNSLFNKPFYRLCYGESDFLPGVVIDRYGEYCVVQLTTAGSELVKQEIIAALQRLLAPVGILLRNDTGARELEGLPGYTEIASGDMPEEIMIEENNCRFYVQPHTGQKTGWFYDHRDNRDRLQHLSQDKQVLDVFSYSGAWGIAALHGGATHATFVDASAQALDYVTRNAALNHYAERIDTLKGDAFDVLKTLQQDTRRFDIVVVDPPAFVKRRKDQAAGLRAYYEINKMALELLKPDGLLVSASCSYHVSAEELLNEIRKAGIHSQCALQVIAEGHQGPDHPVHPSMAETRYIKAFFCRKLALP